MSISTVFLAFLVLLPAAYAVDYTVGDSSGWNQGVNYATWTSGKTFAVGDKLLFNYAGSHSLDVVSKSDYDSCATGNALESHTDGSTSITLSRSGPMYFICPSFGHCGAGMKLTVTVAAGGSPSTPTTPSGSPPPPSTTVSSPPSTSSPTPPASPTPPGSRRIPPTPPSNPGRSPPSSSGKTGVVVGILVGVLPLLIVLTLLFSCYICYKKNRRDHVTIGNYGPPPLGPTDGSISMATAGFSEANLLGQGGFGYVHRGMLPNGKEVAVKQLKDGSGQGEREFQAEVDIISRVHHKHLVSLVGYCMEGAHRMLVYEFVPNNTLEFHLHGKGRPTMEWATRMRIALGSAKGLSYLHEDCHPKTIHRDVKASNILLDFKFDAKVADFGLAKIASDTNTHVSTRVMGTFGYLAPEYAASGKLTDKSDVFSFGVMLLELITGHRPVDSDCSFVDDSLVNWARPLLRRAMEDNNYDNIVDSRLQKGYVHNEMACMVACAAACVQQTSRHRPQLSQVIRVLEGNTSLSDLNVGTRLEHSSTHSLDENSDYHTASDQYDTNQYNVDMKEFRRMVADPSQEYASSEYGRTTGDYGL